MCVCTLLLDIFLLKDDMAIVNDMLKTRQELCVAGRGDLGTLTTQEVLKLFTLYKAWNRLHTCYKTSAENQLQLSSKVNTHNLGTSY